MDDLRQSILAGLSYNGDVTTDPDEDPKLPLRTVDGTKGGTRVIQWPGITIGARVF